MSSSDIPPTWAIRRWRSFSLRTLLIGIFAAALFMGWWVQSDVVVSASLEKPQYMFGEPGYLLFRVSSRSWRDKRIMIGGDYRNRLGRPESFKVKVVDAEGKNVPQPDPGFDMGGISSAAELPARGEYVFRLFLPHWATFDKPGKYTVTVRRTLALLPDRGNGSIAFEKECKRVDVTATTTVSIVPDDAVKLGTLIKKLGDTMLGPDYDNAERAEQVLTAMHDDRVVPYFVQLAEKAHFSPRYAACRALGKYDNDLAFEALKKLTKTTGADIRESATTLELAESTADSVRRSAIIAISKSPHPKAIATLWSFADDPSHSIRLDVLQKAAKVNTPEARAIIERMTTDEDLSVRTEAIRYRTALSK